LEERPKADPAAQGGHRRGKYAATDKWSRVANLRYESNLAGGQSSSFDDHVEWRTFRGGPGRGVNYQSLRGGSSTGVDDLNSSSGHLGGQDSYVVAAREAGRRGEHNDTCPAVGALNGVDECIW
jgi:hypothetical protein